MATQPDKAVHPTALHSNLLPFPERNKGRKRRSQSIWTMGRTIIGHLLVQGEPVPANVALLGQTQAAIQAPARTPAMLLAAAIFAVLDDDQKHRIRTAIAYTATNNPDDEAVQQICNLVCKGEAIQ